MTKIVAIGGGEIRKKETFAIDLEIVRLSGVKNPNLLFIPTASDDSKGYSDVISEYFSINFNCICSVLYTLNKKKTPEFLQEIKEKINNADIIYVGGGNTLKMMKRWRFLGIDNMLKKAGERGAVLSGLSAGSICWFKSGHSDSSFKNFNYINVKGLGLINAVHCPHYSTEALRKNDFSEMIKRLPKKTVGIAIDENCAIEFTSNKYRIISSNNSAKAYVVFVKNDEVFSKEIKKNKKFNDFNKLLEILKK